MRRRILLIAIVGAVVEIMVAILVWQLRWPSDQPPPGLPRARTYSSTLELASDLYRARGECQHPQEPPPLAHFYVYRCPVAGGRLYFFVYTQAMVEDLKAMFGEEFIPEVGDIRGFRRAFGRDNIGFLVHVDVGEVLGPNWVAMSEWRVTLQAVRQAIGGKLIISRSGVDPTRVSDSIPMIDQASLVPTADPPPLLSAEGVPKS